jgi:hypothetical protein
MSRRGAGLSPPAVRNIPDGGLQAWEHGGSPGPVFAGEEANIAGALSDAEHIAGLERTAKEAAKVGLQRS